MNAHGIAHKFGDNIDTDVIIPARYLNIMDKKELATHAMEDIDPEFINKIKPGDIIVAKQNFGCGSSREHAPDVLKNNAISVIIASSFARIFYRNAINIGLPILECEKAANNIDDGDEIKVNFDIGIIKNITKNEEYKAEPFPDFIKKIIVEGDLLNAIKTEKF